MNENESASDDAVELAPETTVDSATADGISQAGDPAKSDPPDEKPGDESNPADVQLPPTEDDARHPVCRVHYVRMVVSHTAAGSLRRYKCPVPGCKERDQDLRDEAMEAVLRTCANATQRKQLFAILLELH